MRRRLPSSRETRALSAGGETGRNNPGPCLLLDEWISEAREQEPNRDKASKPRVRVWVVKGRTRSGLRWSSGLEDLEIQTDEAREHRITMEAVVDAYDEDERAIGWYYHLEEKINFPFLARCAAREIDLSAQGGR